MTDDLSIAPAGAKRVQPVTREILADLLDALDRRWNGETDRKIQNAVSPRTVEAIVAGHEALGNEARAAFWREFLQP